MGEERGWKIAESYDFGRPRIGDAAFASYFDKLFSGRSWRVVNYRDPVPHIPVTDPLKAWHFSHTAPEVFYKTESLSGGSVICSEPEKDMHCSKQYDNIFIDQFYWHYHMSYMDKVPMYGTLPSWAELVLDLPDSGCTDSVATAPDSHGQSVLV